MKALLSWLKDYVSIDLPPDELAEKLNLSGTAVDAVIAQIDPKVIVAQIKKIEPHPNADKLQIAKVFTGIEELQIVCGAPNIAVDQKVPLAQIGTKLQDFEIKKAEIRGVESFGMMCSERELGLSEEHSGIKILPEEWELGQSLSQYLNGDAVLDIEITPNRGDCLSHYGIAREIAAVTKKELKTLDLRDLVPDQNSDLKVEDIELCPQYIAIGINNVQIGESPQWLKDRLMAMGAKSINNVVDITNYIMLDLGQPLHAFDAAKINGAIVIRPAKEAEKIVTLDKVERQLTTDNLVIADQEKPIALAGVMGSENSEVTSETKNIILEAAEFKASNIRFTSKKIGLSTEASYRFERGVDSDLVFRAAQKAAKMIEELAGGKIGYVKMIKTEKPIVKVEFAPDKINSLLGLNLSTEEITQIFERLGFAIQKDEVIVPSWRHDVSIWQDLAEEVGRIYGYDKIANLAINREQLLENQAYFFKEYQKNKLIDLGYTETINYVFMPNVENIANHGLLEIRNPLQKDNKYLRASLLTGLIKNVAKNPAFEPIMLFEVGRVFSKESEKTNLGIIVAGKNAFEKLQQTLDLIGIKEKPRLLEQNILNQYKIRKSQVAVVEIELDKLSDGQTLNSETLDAPENCFSYKKISKYPPLLRDFAFIVDKQINEDDFRKQIFETDHVLLVELFDQFESSKIGDDKKSLAFHVYFQDIHKALSDQEADELSEQVIAAVGEKFGAKLRD